VFLFHHVRGMLLDRLQLIVCFEDVICVNLRTAMQDLTIIADCEHRSTSRKAVFIENPQQIVVTWAPEADDIPVHEDTARFPAREIASLYQRPFLSSGLKLTASPNFHLLSKLMEKTGGMSRSLLELVCSAQSSATLSRDAHGSIFAPLSFPNLLRSPILDNNAQFVPQLGPLWK
jgi:hypothetical protein